MYVIFKSNLPDNSKTKLVGLKVHVIVFQIKPYRCAIYLNFKAFLSMCDINNQLKMRFSATEPHLLLLQTSLLHGSRTLPQ